MADLTVVCVTDSSDLRVILRPSLGHPQAMYIRLGRGRDPVAYEEVPQIEFGRAIRLREGTDLTIITCGGQAHVSLGAAAKLGEKSVSVRVVDMFTIDAIDVEEVRAAVETGTSLAVERHWQLVCGFQLG
ncbi:transketolase C-terminal domain-containing protein [Sedimentitalea sp. XS_ASV28]|uniref:transketolase C-terminal domain-containing protein n=1 Tax=Sedimentitalea sp. XS_ASV28 TaxID=3241296 RepID=UPI0035115D36